MTYTTHVFSFARQNSQGDTRSLSDKGDASDESFNHLTVIKIREGAVSQHHVYHRASASVFLRLLNRKQRRAISVARKMCETVSINATNPKESFCIPVSSISSPRSFVCDPRVVRACVSSRARARACHIAQTRKRLKNARETALFGARVPARRGVARFVSCTYTLARAPYRFAFIATFPITRNSTPHASPLISDRHSLARRRCFFSVG